MTIERFQFMSLIDQKQTRMIAQSNDAERYVFVFQLNQGAREWHKGRLRKLLAVRTGLPDVALFAPSAAWRETSLSLAIP
jgi:hypothetical protein